MNAPQTTPAAVPVESNVLGWVAHQLTVEGPARKVPAYCDEAPCISHGFIESISLDDLFEDVFGANE